MKRLQNKVAVITGACSGIGLATTELFLSEGAQVVAADVQEEVGQQLQEKYAGQLLFAHCDVTKLGELRAAIASDSNGRVFNDPNGSSFVDRLNLSADEAQNEQGGPGDGDDDDSPNNDDGLGDDSCDLPANARRAHKSFVKLLKEERTMQKEAHAEAHAEVSV